MKNKISFFRKQKGLTQPQLAELIGVDYTVIQRYEHSRSQPVVETAIRLARALDTTVEELFVIDEQ